MKIRTGFVSNSSSSSFIAVGLRRPGYGKKMEGSKFEELLEAMGLDTDDHDYEDFERGGKYEHKVNERGYGVFGMKDDSGLEMFRSTYNFNVVGFDVELLLKKDMRLSEMRQLFVDMVKEKYGVDVDPSDVVVECDTTSSE